MPRVFISYRREDSIAYASRLYDYLTDRFPKSDVFMDVDSLRAGDDFVDAIDSMVRSCDVLLAIIGKDWLAAKDKKGRFRLGAIEDFVTLEICAALEARVLVIPLLVGSACMPLRCELPKLLKPIARLQAEKIPDVGFRTSVDRLINSIEGHKRKNSDLVKDVIDAKVLIARRKPTSQMVSHSLGEFTDGMAGESNWRVPLSRYSNSVLSAGFRLKRNHVHVKLHEQLRVETTEEERQLFKFQNQKRVAAGLERQYPEDRVRLLREPHFADGNLLLEVAPFNFATFAVLRDKSTSKVHAESVRKRLAACSLPGSSRSETFDPEALVPLGTEIVLVTSDGKTLLRRRGSNVQTEVSKWDVAVSGYVSTKDISKGIGGRNDLDISETVRAEVENEIDEAACGNPANLVFLGVHHNSETGANDVLACWPISMTSEELSTLIRGRRRDARVRFRTAVEPPEPFVRDTENLIVDFSSLACIKAVEEIHGEGDLFMPEALVCLALALGEVV